MITKFKLFESPNGLKIDNSFYSWSIDTYAFGYYEEFNFEHFLIDKEINHASLARRYFKKKDINLDPHNGRFLLYCGRIFLKPKVITFWRYPETKEILDKIRKDIQKAINIEIDNTWRIEIINFTEEELKLINDEGWWKGGEGEKIIPINDYIGSRNRSEEEMKQQHVLSPMDKRKEKPKGWTPKGIKYRLPGEPDIVAKRRLKYMYQESNELKGKMVNVDYKIYHQDWKENPLTLVTDFKVHRIEDNWIEVIAKGYEYGYLTSYGWAGDFKNRKKKGWVPFDDLSKDRKVIRKFPKKSVQDGTKRIKVYFDDNQV